MIKITTFFFALLIFCTPFNSNALDGNFDIALIQSTAKVKYTCIRVANKNKVRREKRGRFKVLTTAKVKRLLKRQFLAKRLLAQQKPKSTKRALRRNMAKAAFVLAKKCKSGSLAIVRSTDAGDVLLEVPLDALPEGFDANTLSVSAGATSAVYSFPDNDTLLYDLQPDGLQLLNVATLSMVRPAVDPENLSYPEIAFQHLAQDDSLENREDATNENLPLTDVKNSRYGDSTTEYQTEVSHFSKFGVQTITDKLSEGVITVDITAPEEVTVGSSFNVVIKYTREVGVVGGRTFVKARPRDLTVTSVSSDRPWKLKGSLKAINSPAIKPGLIPEAPPETLIATDSFTVNATLKCVKKKKRNLIQVRNFAFYAADKTFVPDFGPAFTSTDNRPTFKAVHFLVDCVAPDKGDGDDNDDSDGDSGKKLCKPPVKNLPVFLPDGLAAKQESYLAITVDPPKVPTSFEFCDANGNTIGEGDFSDDSIAEKVEEIDYEDIPPEAGIDPSPGKNVIYAKITIVGGKGGKRLVTMKAYCD